MDVNVHVPHEEGGILYQWGKQLVDKITSLGSKE
jgi:hypothetical protein